MGRWSNAAFAVLLLVASTAHAGSFRGASVSWRIPDPTAPNTVEISLWTIWDRPTTDTIAADLAFGDGASATGLSGQATYTGTTSLGQGYTLYETTVSHAYAASGTYALVVSGCCRRATTNNSDGTLPFKLTATVALGTGMQRSPPWLVIEPTMTGQGAPYVLIPTAFGDAQSPTVHEATVAESGLAIPQLPDGQGGQLAPDPVIDADNATVRMNWFVTYTTGSTYELAFVVADARGGSSAIDFISEVTSGTSVVGSGNLHPWASQVGGAPGDAITDYGGSVAGLTASLANMPSSATLDVTSAQWDLAWTPAASDLGTSRIALVELVLPDGTHQEWGVAIYVQPQVDECTNGTADCAPTGSECLDMPWGYTCHCGPYFDGDGRTCTAFCGGSTTDFCVGPNGKFGALCCGDQATGNVSCTCPSGGTQMPPSQPAGGGGCTTSGAPGILLAVLALLLPRRRSR